MAKSIGIDNYPKMRSKLVINKIAECRKYIRFSCIEQSFIYQCIDNANYNEILHLLLFFLIIELRSKSQGLYAYPSRPDLFGWVQTCRDTFGSVLKRL